MWESHHQRRPVRRAARPSETSILQICRVNRGQHLSPRIVLETLQSRGPRVVQKVPVKQTLNRSSGVRQFVIAFQPCDWGRSLGLLHPHPHPRLISTLFQRSKTVVSNRPKEQGEGPRAGMHHRCGAMTRLRLVSRHLVPMPRPLRKRY